MNLKVNISIDDYADIEDIQNQIIHEVAIQMLNEVMRNQDHYGRNFKDKLTETVIKMIGNALDDDIKNEITERVKSDIFNKYIRTKQYKELKDENPALTGFVGFGCSFGGKWFGGYARNNTNTNYALQSKRSVMKDVSNLINAKFTCLDYKDVEIPKGSIVYADPPYANTTTYQGQKFDTNEFWDYMRQISKDNKVFISEQNAPDDFKCIWEKPFTRTLDRNKNNQFKVTEKLFTYKNSNL